MSDENKNKVNENKEVKDLVTESEVTVENSNIQIADDVIAVIAGVAVAEVPGVAAMSGGFAGGISEVLSGKKNLSKGIKVEAGEKETKIDVNIIVEFGVRIPDVAFEIQNRVKKAVENMTGLKVVEVNVHVQGVNADTTLDKDNSESKESKKKKALNVPLIGLYKYNVISCILYNIFMWIYGVKIAYFVKTNYN